MQIEGIRLKIEGRNLLLKPKCATQQKLNSSAKAKYIKSVLAKRAV